jgi:hypothetical protein
MLIGRPRPVYANGQKISSTQMLIFLRKYGMAWVCFCRKGANNPMPLAYFTTLPGEVVIVHCEQPFSCGFEREVFRHLFNICSNV